MRARAIALALASACATGGAAQPANHIGGPLAEILVANGCRMAEAEAAAALIAAGWFSSDFQAQALALARGGYLVSPGEAPNVLQLVNWPPCG